METIPLNPDQARAILQEGKNRNMFEDEISYDDEVAITDANTLVAQARRAYEVGNRAEAITNILFIAQVDMKPPVQESSSPRSPDLSLIPDAQLSEMIEALKEQPPTEQIINDLKLLTAEREVRAKREEASQNNGSPAVAETVPTVDPEAERESLINQCTVKMIEAHDLDAIKVFPTLTTEQIRFIVEHPNGEVKLKLTSPVEESVPQIVQEVVVEENVLAAPFASGPAQEEMSPPPPGEPSPVPDQAPPAQPASQERKIAAEREELEEQITGQMLKAYGRGRVDIRSIGDNEIRLMIANPAAQVTPEQLHAARAMDRGEETVSELAQAAPPTSAVVDGDAAGSSETVSVQSPQEDAPIGATSSATASPTPDISEGARIAHEIIARERFPVPPEYEGTPPVFPADISKISDDELRSLHATRHACEVRINWVISQHKDILGDATKMRKRIALEVRKNTPKADEQGRKRTIDDITADVDIHPEVAQLDEQIDSINQTIDKLVVLKESYHSDCLRCSREYSMRKGEAEDAIKR